MIQITEADTESLARHFAALLDRLSLDPVTCEYVSPEIVTEAVNAYKNACTVEAVTSPCDALSVCLSSWAENNASALYMRRYHADDVLALFSLAHNLATTLVTWHDRTYHG